MEKRKDMVHVHVARNIRRLRKQKGWSQEKLALQADFEAEKQKLALLYEAWEHRSE